MKRCVNPFAPTKSKKKNCGAREATRRARGTRQVEGEKLAKLEDSGKEMPRREKKKSSLDGRCFAREGGLKGSVGTGGEPTSSTGMDGRGIQKKALK